MILIEPRGGLGDALLYSTLPERFYKERDEYTFLDFRTKTRNPDIAELIYGMNPYVKGHAYAGNAPTAGAIHDAAFFENAKFCPSPIDLIETLHGFTTRPSYYPKIYYTPISLSEWKDKIFVDPNSISQDFPPNEFDSFFKRLYVKGDVIVAQSKHSGPNGSLSMFGYERELIRNIFHYCDIIFSCREFFCTESGGHVLASALRSSRTRVLMTTQSYNSRFFVFPNVVYTVTGALTPNYLAQDPIWRPS